MELIRGLLGRLARDLTTDRRQAATSGWYMSTGEGRAVAAGTEDLEGLDLDQVLDGRFRAAVLAVAEVNASGMDDGPERFDQIRHTYQRLAAAQQKREAN